MSEPEKRQIEQVVKSSKQLPIVLLTSLQPEHQQQIWRGMQIADPESAKILIDDEDFKSIKEAFNGRLVMDRSEAERYYKAGKKTI